MEHSSLALDDLGAVAKWSYTSLLCIQIPLDYLIIQCAVPRVSGGPKSRQMQLFRNG